VRFGRLYPECIWRAVSVCWRFCLPIEDGGYAGRAGAFYDSKNAGKWS